MKVDDLKFVRFSTVGLNDPDRALATYLFKRIPAELFDQVKGTDNITNRLYEFGPLALASPLTFLYVLVEKDTSLIKGVLWAEINPLNEKLVISTLSLDKEYQGNGVIDKAYEEVLLKIQETENLKGMQLITVCPKTYERKHGWQRSRKVIMEK